MSRTPPHNLRQSLRGAMVLFALGMAGVVALAVTTAPSLRVLPELESVPFALLVALAAVNSTILLAVFVLLGTATAPRIGFRSHVFDWAVGRDADWSQFRESFRTAIGLGIGLFVLVTVLDAAFSPFVSLSAGSGSPAGAVPSDAESLRALAESLPVRLLYGGITEELLLRWGVMAPAAWAIWRLRNRDESTPLERSEHPSQDSSRSHEVLPATGTVWAAIVLSAVLFGAGHLPALASSFGLTPALVVRTVLLNALAGIGFGWLFWRYSLETAMVAHASFHVVLVAVSAGLIAMT